MPGQRKRSTIAMIKAAARNVMVRCGQYRKSKRIWPETTVTCSAFAFAVEKHFNGVFHRTGRGDFAGIDEEDFVGISDRIEAMRNDDFSCRGRQFIEYALQLLFGHRIDVRSRLVEDQDLGIPQNGAHESNQLFLAQADSVATGGDLGVESLFEALKKFGETVLSQYSNSCSAG